MIRAGRWTCSMIQAIVAVLPVPVAPSMVWKRSPATMPSESSAIAVGWSPVGWYASDVLRAVAIRGQAIDGLPARFVAEMLQLRVCDPDELGPPAAQLA